MGYSIGLIIIGVGAFLIYLDHVLTGTLLSGVSAIGLVGLFVANGENTDSQSKE